MVLVGSFIITQVVLFFYYQSYKNFTLAEEGARGKPRAPSSSDSDPAYAITSSSSGLSVFS